MPMAIPLPDRNVRKFMVQTFSRGIEMEHGCEMDQWFDLLYDGEYLLLMG